VGGSSLATFEASSSGRRWWLAPQGPPSSCLKITPTELRSSNRKLKPLPPDPFRHQDSAIVLHLLGETQWLTRAAVGSIPPPPCPRALSARAAPQPRLRPTGYAVLARSRVVRSGSFLWTRQGSGTGINLAAGHTTLGLGRIRTVSIIHARHD
jgi:hypothetical protein